MAQAEQRVSLLGLLKLMLIVPAFVLLSDCVTVPQPAGDTPSTAPVQTSPTIEQSLKNLGIASPSSLLQAENALGESTAGYSNYGLELSYVTYKMIEILYPLYMKPEYVIYPPTASIFPDLFRQVQAGKFPIVGQNDVSFLTLIIPPLAVLYSDKADVVESSIEALDHAETLNSSSVLPPYLKGFIDERRGNESAALAQYDHALSVDPSCYPAALGRARILVSQRQFSEAATALDRLIPTIPPDEEGFRLQAEARFGMGAVAAAGQAISQALALSPDDASALILSARIHETEGDFATALEEVSKAEKSAKVTPETLLLRAKLQRERGNQAAAVQVLAAGVKQFPKNNEISDAYGKLLIETGQAAEGGKYLIQSGSQNPNGADTLEVHVTDAINSGNWKAAEVFVERLLALKSSEQILHQAYEIYRALGDKEKEMLYASKLHEAAPANGPYLVDYLRSLISVGKSKEAMSLIADGLKSGGAPATMSSLYYLRSRLQSDPVLELRDLRSALFENLANEDALIATTRYYVRSGDLRSARIYAQQAQAFLPSGKELPDDVAKLLAAGR